MGATLTTASNILKEIYEPNIQKQLQEHSIAAKRIDQTSEGVSQEVGGKYVVFPIHVKRNHGIGARNEMELLPTAQNQGYETARIGLSYQYGAIRLTGQTMKLAKTKAQSFASVLDEEVNGIRRDIQKDYNRQVYGTTVGAMLTANATYTTNTIPTDNTQYMEVGMAVDVFASNASTNKATNRLITAVNKNTSIVVDGAAIASGAANDIVVRTGSINREIVGFDEIVSDTTTLFNLNPSSVPIWKSVIDSNSGTPRPLSESLMIEMADDIYINGGNVTVIFCPLPIRRSYFNLLVQQRQFHNTKEFTGGFTGLVFTTDRGEIPVISDVDCQPERMYFLNEKQIKMYRDADWAWMDEDGSRWVRVQGYDAYDATLFKYFNMGTHRRNTHGKILDLIES